MCILPKIQITKATVIICAIYLVLNSSTPGYTFDTRKLEWQGSLVLEELMPLIEKTPKLKNEVVQAARRIGKTPQDIACMGQRFGSEWEYLGGTRVAPYTCQIGGLILAIEAKVHLFGPSRKLFDNTTHDAMKRARNISESDLTWRWLPGGTEPDKSSSELNGPGNSQANPYEYLIGTEFEGDIAISGLEYQGGGLVAEPVWYSYYKRNDNSYLVLAQWALPRKPDAKHTPFRVTDVLLIPPIAKDLTVAFLCWLSKDKEPEYFAVVYFDKRQALSRDVRKAWAIDVGTGMISTVPTQGIACQNEGTDY